MIKGSCPNRVELPAMNTMSRSLDQMNYFRDSPDFVSSCKENSAPLENMMNTCYNVSVNRWPNFIAVDVIQLGGCVESSLNIQEPFGENQK